MPENESQFEVHDKEALAHARSIMNATESPRAWAQEVIAAVKRNEAWRGERCINLLARVKQFGGGLEVAHRLAQANIITNKNLVPEDKPEDWDRPSGLRMGTIEATRLGMNEADMETIAEFIARVLVKGEDPEIVGKDAMGFRLPKQTIYYNFDHEYPAWAKM